MWKVYLFDTDITTKVSEVRVSYAADNIAGECTVTIADRRGILPATAPVVAGAQLVNGGYNLSDLDWLRLRTLRALPIRVEEWLPGHWPEPDGAPGVEWINGELVYSQGDWPDFEDAGYHLRGCFTIDQVTFGPDMDQRSATIWGRTKSAFLASPYAGKISKQWRVTGTTTVMQEVAMPYGVDVRAPYFTAIYDEALGDPLPRGYPLCDGCYSVDARTPAEIVQEVMALSGDRMAPWSDGSLRYLGWGTTKRYLNVPYRLLEVAIGPPDYGARIYISSEGRPDRTVIEVKTLTVDEQEIPADGISKARLVAVVWGEGGQDTEFAELPEGATLLWDATDGSMEQGTGNLESHGYIVEQVTATEYTKATLRHTPKHIAAVYLSEHDVPQGFGPLAPKVSSYPEDTSENNAMVTYEGEVEGRTITFAESLPFYDQDLWVLYEPDGYYNTFTAGERQGPVVVSLQVKSARGMATIQQGVPSGKNRLAFFGTQTACYGSGSQKLVVIGQIFGQPATGTADFEIEGCGQLDVDSASFGQETISETLVVEETSL